VLQMDLSAITWSSLIYTAEEIAHHSLPVIVRQRSASSQRQASDTDYCACVVSVDRLAVTLCAAR